jgi:hypothetical protein
VDPSEENGQPFEGDLGLERSLSRRNCTVHARVTAIILKCPICPIQTDGLIFGPRVGRAPLRTREGGSLFEHSLRLSLELLRRPLYGLFVLWALQTYADTGIRMNMHISGCNPFEITVTRDIQMSLSVTIGNQPDREYLEATRR